MKCSELINRLQGCLETEGDLEIVLGTMLEDGQHMAFYDEPKAAACQIPEDDDGMNWRRVMLIGWDEVFLQPSPNEPPRPKLTRVK